jgi:hypothetical protein
VRALLGRSAASRVVKWARCAPCTSHVRRVGYEVIHGVL